MRLNDLDATYPITVAPLVCVEQKVFASAEEYDQFGFAVALSGDGNTALVGAQAEDVAAKSDQGAAWTQEARLTVSDGVVGDYFGRAVAFDGDTALVGAYLGDVGANSNQGAAYFFRREFRTYLPLVLGSASQEEN